VDQYVRHLPEIEALKSDLSGLSGLLLATGWTEGRLAYVVSKTGLALLERLDPEAPTLKSAPPFARPTPEEAALVSDRERDIARAYAQIIQAARAKERPKPPARKARRGPSRGTPREGPRLAPEPERRPEPAPAPATQAAP
jgi:hypothetical protein